MYLFKMINMLSDTYMLIKKEKQLINNLCSLLKVEKS